MTSSSTAAMPRRRAGSRRRTQEERSSETRLKLLNATVEMLIERGYSRLTVDDVSSRAGVTNGARAHHYATKLDLMVETFKHLQAPVHAAARGAAEQAMLGQDPLGAFFDHSISVLLTQDAIAFTELLVGARADAALRARITPLIDSQHAEIIEPWAEMLMARGFPADQVRPMIAGTMFLMRGIVSDPLMNKGEPNIASVLNFWRDTISARSPPPATTEEEASARDRRRTGRSARTRTPVARRRVKTG